MDKPHKRIKPTAVGDNVFSLIGTDWMLITAGTPESYNTMTASWGGMGVLWNKQVCFCFVRPTRYTHEFMEKSSHFTLSFFDDSYREALNFCGSNSGREVDKAEKTGLTPVRSGSGAVYFEQARMVFECEKIYFQDLIPDNFLKREIEGNYPQKDYHRMYIGEITACLLRE